MGIYYKNLYITFLLALEGLCLLLARLSTPAKLTYHVQTFNRDRSTISRIFLWMIEFIYTNFACKVEDFDESWLNEKNLEYYAEVRYKEYIEYVA